MVGEHALERFAGILTSLIGVMQEGVRFAARHSVIVSASMTSCAVIDALIDQPTIFRERRRVQERTTADVLPTTFSG